MPLQYLELRKLASSVPATRCYWLAIVVGGIAMLALALYSQYVDGKQPCTLCIQVRLWISLAVLISLAVTFLRENRVVNLAGQSSIVLIAVVMTERSWQLLGNERGFIVGECGFDLGLPAWFRIEDWIPWLYRIETTCGKTPEVLFGITMAEALLLLSIAVLLAAGLVLLAYLLDHGNKAG